MDEMTQHNAALVEQTNAAIEQTEAQANELDRIVDVFKVSAGDMAGGSAQAQSPVRALQDKVVSAAKTYLGGRGGGAAKAATARDEDWAEF
jgi:methyl-accepting chemotaxis protein